MRVTPLSWMASTLNVSLLLLVTLKRKHHVTFLFYDTGGSFV
jgi:hypothetical protein